MLKYDGNRALSARWIYISVFATPFFLMISRMDAVAGILRAKEPPAAGWTNQFILDTLQGDAMLFFLPVICALPYASSFVDEAKSGVTKFVLTRVKCSRYLSSKAAAAAISGGAVVMLGILAFLCAALVLFLPLEEGNRGQELAAALPEYGRLLCRYFCLGALGAETGLWLSTLLYNRYMAWLSPFMAEYLLIIFCERYFPECKILYPAQWLKPEDAWPWNGWSVVCWLALLCGASAAGFFKAAKRRLGRG